MLAMGCTLCRKARAAVAEEQARKSEGIHGRCVLLLMSFAQVLFLVRLRAGSGRVGGRSEP